MTQDKTDAPKTIWLQVGDEPCSYSEAMICGDVSWCANKVFDYDIEYKLVEPIKPQPTPSKNNNNGFVLVPEKANSIMINHGANMLRELQNKFARTRSLQDIVYMVYMVMIEAAPKLSKPQPTSQDVIDAERYRWLRKSDFDIFGSPHAIDLEKHSLDKAIDDAMKESE